MSRARIVDLRRLGFASAVAFKGVTGGSAQSGYSERQPDNVIGLREPTVPLALSGASLVGADATSQTSPSVHCAAPVMISLR